MLKSFVSTLPLFVAAVVAQSSSSNSSTLIPPGISAACSAFLTELNTDSSLSTCTSSLITALSAFSPGSNTTISASTVTDALTNVCSSSVSSSCPENLIGSKITQFYTACAPELTSNPVAQVGQIYDVLYSITPMKNAICSTDDSGKWCVLAATPSSGSASALQAALYTRQDSSTIIPNANTFSANNIPFLFLTPSLDATALCTTCARNALTSYIKFESDVPYGPGLAKSQLLNTQAALFSAVQDKCGATFMDSEVKAAGGISSGSNNILGSGAVPMINSEFQSLVALVAGLATLAVTSTF